MKQATIELSDGSAQVSVVPERILKAFLGGRGLNMLQLARRMGGDGRASRLDPFDPTNPLIFGVGLLTGTLAPTAARFNVSAKSPETMGLGDANCGGFFAAAMRRAGFDQLNLIGRAAEPSYLLLEDGLASLHPADGLWGLDTWETQEQLKARHGPGTISAVIGPAGENRVRMAAVMTGKKNTAGRCGMGAVMGAKNLKAIAARGGSKLETADPAAMRGARIRQTKHLKQSRVVQILGMMGTPFIYNVSNRMGLIRTRNAQDGFFEDSLNGERIEEYSDKMLACTSCVVICRHRNTLGGEGPEYSTVGLLGANLGIGSAEQVVQLNNLVNDLGLDASSTGSIIGWAMELYQRGLLSEGVAGGPLEWGDFERVYRLIEDIAHRRGLGDLLAESTQAKHSLAPEAQEYLIAVKDLPQSDPHDVRYIKSFALGLAVSSRGADHLRNRPTLDIMRLPDELREEIFGFETNAEMTAYDGKAGMVAWHDDINAVADCLGICRFVTRGFNSPNLLGYEEFTELIHAASGYRMTPEEIASVGKRVIDLERWLNLQFGRTRADDTLPKRHFDDPLPARITKGHHIEREAFERMLDEYYQVRGWDELGRLKPERLAQIEGYLQLDAARG